MPLKRNLIKLLFPVKLPVIIDHIPVFTLVVSGSVERVARTSIQAFLEWVNNQTL